MTSQLQSFIQWLSKGPYAPYNSGDIKDTNGQSVLIRAMDDKAGGKSLYFSFSEDDGRGFGHVYSCRTSEGDYWYSKAEKTWTDEERKAWDELRERKKAEAIAAQQERYETVASDCKARYKTLSNVSQDHTYLVTKAIRATAKTKQDGDLLVIPAIDINNKIWTFQTIDGEGNKRFSYGGKKEGTFFPIGLAKGDAPDHIRICEGYATGVSIFEATDEPVIVAWDAGNLMPVCKAIRTAYPIARLTICADNDQWTIRSPRPKELKDISGSDVSGDDPRWPVWESKGWLVNTGMEAAAKAGYAVDAQVVAPEFISSHPDKPTDYNDAANILGIDYIKNRLLAASAVIEVAPVVVEQESPNSYAPAAGDEIVYSDSSYDHMYDFEAPVEARLTRSDGNPEWFTDIIWDKEPNGKIANMYQIKGMHDGKSLSNLITFIRGYWKGLFVLNEFSDEIIVRVRPPWLTESDEFRVHRVTDSDRVNMAAKLEWFGFRVSDQIVGKAINSIAEKDKIHPVMTYFKSLEWDGVPRLGTWLRDYCGADKQDEEYLSVIGTRWMMAGVARIFQPGCQFSHMLVLEGPQDIGKSALFKELATFGHDVQESYYTDAVSMKDFDKTFSAMMWQGKLIIEFAELDGMDKAGIDTVKAWITRRADEYQKKHSNDITTSHRQFILGGSTNRSTWITDTTGGKRFWPVSCTRIDIQGIKQVREQLWAEAVHVYADGKGKWWLSDDDPIYALAKAEQTARLAVDEWQEIIGAHVKDAAIIYPREVYEWLHIDIQFLDVGKSSRIRSAMNGLGYEYKQAYALTKDKARVWVKR